MKKCSYCNEDVREDYNVCPYCGEPLNDLAKSLFDKKAKVAQVKIISALIDKVTDKTTIELLKAMMDRLAQ